MTMGLRKASRCVMQPRRLTPLMFRPSEPHNAFPTGAPIGQCAVLFPSVLIQAVQDHHAWPPDFHLGNPVIGFFVRAWVETEDTEVIFSFHISITLSLGAMDSTVKGLA
jgi:hypothetical protein